MTTHLSPDITTIAFDADDTLWHNENFFHQTEERFCEIMADFSEAETLKKALLDRERDNIALYGYGVKGFTLSMVETAFAISEGRVDAQSLNAIVHLGKEMLAHPVEVFPGVRECMEALCPNYRLLIITKGDLAHQESKIERSGLAELCQATEIVSEKTSATYRDLFQKHGEGAERSVMIGNSLKSDVIPALEAGAWGIYIPYQITWALEASQEPNSFPRYRKLESVNQLLACFS